MNEKSSEWREYRIDELGQVVTGHTPLKSVKEYYESNDYTLIKPTDIRKGERYVSETEEYYSQKAYEKYKSALLPPLSTCVVTIGTVGEKICLTHKPCFTNQSINAIIPNREKFDPMFVYYLLKYNLDQVAQRNPGTASGRHHVSKSNISSIIVKAPLKPTQLKISSILARYDDLLENNTRRIKILEEIAQAIYREWFVHFRFPGHKGVRMVESELGLIPEGWEVEKVPDAIIVNPRIRLQKEGIKPFLSMGCLAENTMNIQTIEYREGNSGSKYQNGDTLFARITPCLENGKTVFIQFLNNDSEVGFGSTEFIVLRSKTLTPEFVYLLSRTDSFRDNAIKSMSGATGRQRVQEECFDKYYFAHPDGKTLAAFDEIMQPFFKDVYLLSKKNTNLRRTRDLLLPKLISGEMDVSELDIMIPEALT
jgi:type I restriction enzyme S subunit